jgi:hypothetical protein
MEILNSRFNAILMCVSSQDKIMRMECEILISSCKNPKTVDLVNENIGRIADGSSPHSANALKLGLEKAFDLKKPPPIAEPLPPPIVKPLPPPGVKLRCSWTGCPGYNDHVSISSVRNSCQGCPDCSYNYLQCVGCGYTRLGNVAACEGCGQKFV